MDSSGLRILLGLRQTAPGSRVAFQGPGAEVGRLLDLTGVRAMLRWVAEPGQALAQPASP
jgi:hypothetical protein